MQFECLLLLAAIDDVQYVVASVADPTESLSLKCVQIFSRVASLARFLIELKHRLGVGDTRYVCENRLFFHIFIIFREKSSPTPSLVRCASAVTASGIRVHQKSVFSTPTSK